ncbi:MAG: LysR family transcriptional regulator [Pseudomonadota bacterium]
MLTDDAPTRPQMRAALDITILRTLVMIVDSGGFTRAAERLGITQSAVSLQIKRLEEATGQSMFVREGRQVHLTSDGEMLLDYAREIVRLEEEARLRLVEPGERRSVSLWATEDIATAYLNNLQAASQRIALNVRSDNPASVVNQMAQGAFDLALVRREPGATRGGAWRHDLAWIEPLAWIGPVGTKTEEFSGRVPLILPSPPSIARQRMLDLVERERPAWRIVLSTTSLSMRLEAVRRGLGVSIAPRHTVPADLTVLEDMPPITVPALLAMARSRNSISSEARRIEEMIVALLDQRLMRDRRLKES